MRSCLSFSAYYFASPLHILHTLTPATNEAGSMKLRLGESQPSATVTGFAAFLSRFRSLQALGKSKRQPPSTSWPLFAAPILAALLLCEPTYLAAQQAPIVVPPVSNTGLPEGASFEGANEVINLNNGDVLVTIPLLSLPGLAGLDFKLNLRIDSKIYGMWGDKPPKYEYYSGTYTYTPPGFGVSPKLGGIPFAGGRLSLPDLTWNRSDYGYYEDDPLHSGSGSWQTVSCRDSFVFTDTNGTMSGFGNLSTCLPNNGRTTPIDIDDAHDGSLMRLDSSNPHDVIVYDKSGIQYHFDTLDGIYDSLVSTRITDLNGNTITITHAGTYPDYTYTIKDSLNRTVTITPTIVSYQDSDGQSRQITSSNFTDATDKIQMLFTFTQSSDGQQYWGNETPGLYGFNDTHSTLSLPTGETYTFYYDALQELTKIQYPSGGYTRYVYQNVPGLYSDSLFYVLGDVREIQQRAICARTGSNCSASEEAVTNYEAHTKDSSGYTSSSNLTMDVRDPYSNRTHYAFSMANQYYEIPIGGASKETDRYIYSGENTLLRTIHTDYYTDNTYSYAQIRGCSQPKTVTTTYNDISPAQQSRVEYEYDTIQLIFTSYGETLCGATRNLSSNVTKERKYDFDGSLIRTTTTGWFSSSPDGSHLLDRLSSETITDATGFTSTKGWGYDGSGNLTSRTFGGTAMDDATTVLNRDSYGRLISSTDPLNNVRTYGYDSPWADSACASTSAPPLSPLPSSVKDALNHTTSTLYNSCTSTAHSITDANGQATTFQYDAIARQTHITYPSAGGEITTTYDPSAGATITRVRTLDATRSATTKEVHDGVGRIVSQQNLAPQEGTTTVESTYDRRGLIASTSNPFVSNSDATYGITSYAYDALGRKQLQCQPDDTTLHAVCDNTTTGNSFLHWSYSGPTTTSTDENGNAWVRTTDALGRLRKVGEPNGASTTYTYNAQSDLLTVTQSGVSGDTARATRNFYYDGLSRLLAVSNPETTSSTNPASLTCVPGGPWTTCYTYDPNGNLQTKTDNRNVTVHYSYDGLNRLVAKWFSGQGDAAIAIAAATLSSCYQYDGATIGVGRLSIDWTQSGMCATSPPANLKSMRTVLAYDSMGRVLQDQRCTGVRCNLPQFLRPMAYNYDFVGNQTKSSDGLSTRSFITQYDQAGRLLNFGGGVPGSAMSLFSVQSYGPVGFTGGTIGAQMSVQRTYDNRTRLAGETVVIP
jgi:YD repeat-containing protein